MAKNTKKSATNHGKPITSFFARTPKPPPASSQDVPSSSSETASSAISSSKKTKTSTFPALNTDMDSPQEVPQMVTKNSIPQERRTSVSSSRKADTLSSFQAPLTPSTSSSSLKRSRIPDVQLEMEPSASRNCSESLKSHDHRKAKFDSDSDVEPSSAIVYVTSTPNSQRKKARLSPPEDEVPRPVIPSSQSEGGLVFNTPNSLTPKTVSQDFRSRKQASSVTAERIEHIIMSMDAEGDSSKDTRAPTNFEPTSVNSSPQRNLISADQMLTPPPSDLPSLPPTPEVLDAATKTAIIIADIKAKAYADTASSPEPVPLEFNEKLDSSSDEEDLVPLIRPTSKTVMNLSSIEPTRRSTRYSLRNKSPSSPSNESRQKTSIHQQAQGKTSPNGKPAQNNRGKKFATVNPFTALLKEKKAAERRGGGSDAFRKAEMIASNIDRYCQDEDTDMDTDKDTIDWDAAARTARKMPWYVDNSSSSSNLGPSSPQVNPGDEDQRTLFGGKKGKGQIIVDILENDKVSQREQEFSQTKAGIRIWASSNADVDNDKNRTVIDEEFPYHQLRGDSSKVYLLNSRLQRHDTSQASMLLDMDILPSLPISERPHLASSLCSLALSPYSGDLGKSATHALERFWSSSSEQPNSTINFAQVLKTFNQLGMEASVLTSQNWTVRSSHKSQKVELEERENIIRRLILLAGACAGSKRLEVTEISNMTMALLLLGMDSEAPPDLLEDVTRVANLVCHCLSGKDQDIENDLCLKILHCVGSYTPINKARMIALLSAGSGITHSIATAVCYNVITNNDSRKVILSDLPPLPEIVDQLISYSGRNGTTPGKFAIYDHTDYDDLGFYTFILGVAVSNIRGYALQELLSKSKTSVLLRPESPTKNGEKQGSDIQMLIDSLENLHNKISDTRAAHLERSRAKATIKGLAMTIHYQNRFWQRNDAEGRAKTLAQYFKKKDKP